MSKCGEYEEKGNLVLILKYRTFCCTLHFCTLHHQLRVVTCPQTWSVKQHTKTRLHRNICGRRGCIISAHRSWRTSSTVARDQAWVSQLKGQYWPFSLVSSGSPFQDDLRNRKQIYQILITWPHYADLISMQGCCKIFKLKFKTF